MGKGKVRYAALEVCDKFLPTCEELVDDWAVNKVLVSKKYFLLVRKYFCSWVSRNSKWKRMVSRCCFIYNILVVPHIK